MALFFPVWKRAHFDLESPNKTYLINAAATFYYKKQTKKTRIHAKAKVALL